MSWQCSNFFWHSSTYKGPSINDVRSQEGGRVSSDADIRTFWCKNFGFFEIFMVCPHEQGELSHYGYFSDKEEGSIFRDFVRTSPNRLFIWHSIGDLSFDWRFINYQGRWEVDPGPVPEIIPGPLQTKFHFSRTQILRYRIFQCFRKLGSPELSLNQNANLVIIKFTWINFVLPCFSKCFLPVAYARISKRWV